MNKIKCNNMNKTGYIIIDLMLIIMINKINKEITTTIYCIRQHSDAKPEQGTYKTV